MRILEVTKEYILFDNGSKISYLLENRLCEQEVIIDFRLIDDKWENVEFDRESLSVQFNKSYRDYKNGFWICDNGTSKIFVPVLKRKDNSEYSAEYYEYVTDESRFDDDDFDWDLFGEATFQHLKILLDNILLDEIRVDNIATSYALYPYDERPIIYDLEKAMKIIAVTDQFIKFSNGKKITYWHDYDGGEINYADFKQIDDLSRKATYYENELIFEAVEGCGFRFGNRGGFMAFIPCYSLQNGYYCMDVLIEYDNEIAVLLNRADDRFVG